LEDEVEKWGNWVIEKVRVEIGDLYPSIVNQKFEIQNQENENKEIEKKEKIWDQLDLLSASKSKSKHKNNNSIPEYLTPVAYLWTRTVKCPNPACGAAVPLVRQTWLCKKAKKYVALKVIPNHETKQVEFEVVEAETEKGLGFDPSSGSSRGNSTCRHCGTTVDVKYVKKEGVAGKIGQQLMAIVCTTPGEKGKTYLSGTAYNNYIPDEVEIKKRLNDLCTETKLTVPDEPIEKNDTLNFKVPLYGLIKFKDLFTQRQLIALMTFVKWVKLAHQKMLQQEYEEELAKAISTYLGILCDRLTDYNSSITHWHNTRELIGNTFARQALPMVWDFAEINPLGNASGNAKGALDWILQFIRQEGSDLSLEGKKQSHDANNGKEIASHSLAITENNNYRYTRNEENRNYGILQRSSATSMSIESESLDAVITDPPYFDSISYADLSDFFYVWLKRSIGHLYPEHFSSQLTPKKNEAIMSHYRHGKDKKKASEFYQDMMHKTFCEANRVLKQNGMMVVVYAHKTTSGWSTLIDSLRRAGFIITEAWPLDTEMKSRTIAQNSAALASSIFLVSRKRTDNKIGDYTTDVRPLLSEIIRDRVTAV
jgi:putative DNA methylase